MHVSDDDEVVTVPFTKAHRKSLTDKYHFSKKKIYYGGDKSECRKANGTVRSNGIRIDGDVYGYDSVLKCFHGQSDKLVLLSRRGEVGLNGRKVKTCKNCDICGEPLTNKYEIRIGMANHEACWLKWVAERRESVHADLVAAHRKDRYCDDDDSYEGDENG